jgi:hypothetical protein
MNLRRQAVGLRRTDYLILFLLGICVNLMIAAFQPAPGYMDADYYYAGGLSWVNGKGEMEPFLWNYLDDPVGLPHPAYTYWMPLAALLAAAGMKFTGIYHFSTARLGFLCIAGCLPALTAVLAYRFTPHRWAAVLAGILAVFPGFYLRFLPTTDTFGIYMLLGGAFFLVAHKGMNFRESKAELDHPLVMELKHIYPTILFPLALGACAGLMHLTRADGLLWLLPAMLFSWLLWFPKDFRSWHALHGLQPSSFLLKFLPGLLATSFCCFLGYGAIIAFWLNRNLTVFGRLLPPGSGRALWITNYNELFIYPASILTPMHWASSGLGTILQARSWALGTNLQTIIAVEGEIFLLPLMMIGLWELRRKPAIQLLAGIWCLIFIAMTFVFPFAGARGGFFHAIAAFQILLWAIVPVGLESFLGWGQRRRGWNPKSGRSVFGLGLIGLSVLFTALTTYPSVIGPDLTHPVWGRSESFYTRLEVELTALGANPNDVVMVNNPPGYTIATGRRSVVIPYSDRNELYQAARRYQAHYLLLETDQVTDLYQNPGSVPGFEYLRTFEGTRIYRIVDR